MSRKEFAAAVAGLVASLLSGLAPAAEPASTPAPSPLVRHAQTINNSLTQTSYSYGLTNAGQPEVQQQAPGQWTAYTDCSGWVSYNVKSVLPRQFEAVMAFKSETFPLEKMWNFPRAFVYEAYFNTVAKTPGAAFTSVSDLTQVQPGDIIAWCLGDWCNTQAFKKLKSEEGLKGDTGHIMIVVGTASAVPNTTPGKFPVYKVPVLDSSDLVHYPYDDAALPLKTSRTFTKGCGTNRSVYNPSTYKPGQTPTCGGVGPGYIYFAVDPVTKAPQQFQFGPGDAFNPATPSSGRISIGRPVLPNP